MKSAFFLAGLLFALSAGAAAAQGPAFHVTKDGKVGLGTTNPAKALQLRVQAGSKDGLMVDDGANQFGLWSAPASGYYLGLFNDSDWTLLGFWNNGAERMRITPGGVVGIGTTNPAGGDVKLHVAGRVVCDGGCTSSSREAKLDVVDLHAEDAMDAVAELKPVRFRYKYDPEEEHLGFISEEVPDLVAAKGRRGLDAMDLVAVLTKALQEQQSLLEEQEARIRRLETGGLGAGGS